jgi:hypothetical protein
MRKGDKDRRNLKGFLKNAGRALSPTVASALSSMSAALRTASATVASARALMPAATGRGSARGSAQEKNLKSTNCSSSRKLVVGLEVADENMASNAAARRSRAKLLANQCGAQIGGKSSKFGVARPRRIL